MSSYFSLLSLSGLGHLPYAILIPGLLAIALMVYRASRAVFRLQFFGFGLNLFWAFCIALILSRGGEAYRQLSPPPECQVKPASTSDSECNS